MNELPQNQLSISSGFFPKKWRHTILLLLNKPISSSDHLWCITLISIAGIYGITKFWHVFSMLNVKSRNGKDVLKVKRSWQIHIYGTLQTIPTTLHVCCTEIFHRALRLAIVIIIVTVVRQFTLVFLMAIRGYTYENGRYRALNTRNCPTATRLVTG